jgi:hypothetical protein
MELYVIYLDAAVLLSGVVRFNEQLIINAELALWHT